MIRFSLRLPDEVEKEVIYLADMMNTSRNEAIINCIRCQYHSVAEDPKIAQMSNQLKEMQKVLEDWDNKFKELA